MISSKKEAPAMGGVRVVTWLGAVLTTVLCGLPGQVQAAGVEDSVSGTRALGRGAYYARVRDFMATWQNPANLALGSGLELGGNLREPFFDACFERLKDPSKTYISGDAPFEEVCNDAFALPSGSLGMRMALGDSLGLGVGVFTPAGVGNLRFGDDTVRSVQVTREGLDTTPEDAVPTPSRFLLIDRTVLASFVMVGIGYAPMDEIRVGLSAGAAFADINFRNVAATAAGGSENGEPFQQQQEVLNDVYVTDWFIPRATLSLAGTLLGRIDWMVGLTWNDDVEEEGYVRIRANGLQGGALGDCRSQREEGNFDEPGTYCQVDGAELKVPFQRLQGVFGLRYAHPSGESTGDPMQDEVFDLEINAFWDETSHVDLYGLGFPVNEAETDVPGISFGGGVERLDLPRAANIPHEWSDTYGLRLGGDYNLLPGKLALRSGVLFETRGVPVKNMNIDYWPVQRLSVHAGLTYRMDALELHAAYSHSFNETVVVAVGEGNIQQVVALDELGEGWTVNEGTFRSSSDVVALGGNYRF